MKRLLSLLVMSLMLASCYIEESGSHLEIIKDEYALDDETYWEGGIIYKIYSEQDFFTKVLEFSADCTKCTLYTGVSFINGLDKEELVVRSDGANRLIFTEEGRYGAIYRLYFTKGTKDSFEMKWKNHTKLEKDHIPDKSFTVTMHRSDYSPGLTN
ncbi:MAG TPA: hypothetical protein PL115_06100 [Bacteroidales bacterium]|jgi:hypothetical protein|nr:hypothetical protein [Bacteroidales bacterium]HKM13143.1 hypothetical protein [Bacteroidales bacterium]HPB89493.1 hypothetical protein [Bacteroidales bacterium]HPY21282.1 hypothetical protein [Bacteroidales bacterium]HQA92671.1 hypothetical protein [Bacteroidales bacterium]